jgi:hypothetical protein
MNLSWGGTGEDARAYIFKETFLFGVVLRFNSPEEAEK